MDWKNSLLGILVLTLLIFVVFFSDGGITEEVVRDFDSGNSVCADCNVILILIDTLRADHVGAYGYERDTTPNIDKLAAEGIVFKNMLAQSSWTKPGTAAIMTGLYPKNHGANNEEDILGEEFVLLPEILEKHGFKTYGFQTNPSAGSPVGFNQGYDKFFEEGIADANARKVNEAVQMFIKSIRKTKNFIYIHYIDPHALYEPPDKHFSKENTKEFTEKLAPILLTKEFFNIVKEFERNEKFAGGKSAISQIINLYDDEILFNDKMVGELIEMLRKQGLYDNSIIIIVSDHGEEFLDHNGYDHGSTLYDEQLKVPWIMKVPGKEQMIIEKQVNQVDILPTLLPLLGLNSVPVDGIDVFSQSEKFSYAELDLRGNVMSAIRTDEEKMITGKMPDDHVWFEESVTLNIDGEIMQLPIMSFLTNRQLQVTVDDLNAGVIDIVPRQKIMRLDLRSMNIENPKDLKLTSLSPCIPVSKEEGAKCLSFGISLPNNEGEGHSIPFYGYYNLSEDPGEQVNLYEEENLGKEELRKVLKKYLSNENKNQQNEKPKYSQEQLDALRALGYVN